ncbi:MAG TPA: hypothetical protein VFC36_08280, partial [Paludibacter sp.]|nr:hypothetical protein [Paludibacter sp.]
MKQLFVIALLSTQLCAFAQKERAYQVSIEDKDKVTLLLRQATNKLDKGLSNESYPLIFKALSCDSTS